MWIHDAARLWCSCTRLMMMMMMADGWWRVRTYRSFCRFISCKERERYHPRFGFGCILNHMLLYKRVRIVRVVSNSYRFVVEHREILIGYSYSSTLQNITALFLTCCRKVMLLFLSNVLFVDVYVTYYYKDVFFFDFFFVVWLYYVLCSIVCL